MTTLDETLKVTISLMGRAHGYNLAAELHKLGCLHRLMSSQPRFRSAEWGVPSERVRVFPTWEVAQRLGRRLGLETRVPHFTWATFEMHDRTVARHLEPADVVVAWYQVGLHTLRRARALGAKTVLERGSTHMAYQQDLLDEEFARFGQKRRPGRSRRSVEKALMEYEEADAIAVPSHWVRRSFVERGVPESKLIHVPYGVNLDEFYPGQKRDTTFRAIFAGALTLQKGIPYLLDAVKLAGVPLWMMGGVHDEVRPFLARCPRSVELKGHVPQRTLRDYYAQCDVFVLASVQEGLAMVLLQALACGLPVICTVNTGGEDVVTHGETGFIVPPRRPDLIAEHLTRLRDDPERLARMKRAARASVEGRFSWSDYATRLVGEYRKLLAR